MRLKGIRLEPMTFREMFWFRLWPHTYDAVTLVPADLNIWPKSFLCIELCRSDRRVDCPPVSFKC